jgi:hypothetical protein
MGLLLLVAVRHVRDNATLRAIWVPVASVLGLGLLADGAVGRRAAAVAPVTRRSASLALGGLAALVVLLLRRVPDPREQLSGRWLATSRYPASVVDSYWHTYAVAAPARRCWCRCRRRGVESPAGLGRPCVRSSGASG